MRETFPRIFQYEFFWLTILACFISAKLSISKYKKIDNKSVSMDYPVEFFIKKTISKGYAQCVSGCEQMDVCIFVAFVKGQPSTNECFYYKYVPTDNQLIYSYGSTLFLKSSNFLFENIKLCCCCCFK